MVADQHRQRATQSAATLPSDVMVPPREKCARLAFGAREPSKRFVLFLRGEGASSLAPTDANAPRLGLPRVSCTPKIWGWSQAGVRAKNHFDATENCPGNSHREADFRENFHFPDSRSMTSFPTRTTLAVPLSGRRLSGVVVRRGVHWLEGKAFFD